MIKRSLTKLDGEHPRRGRGQPVPSISGPLPKGRSWRSKRRAGLKSEYNLYNRVWKPAVLRAKLRERSPYQCRHTFATIALSAGEEIGWVARQMGHESTEMVVRHYDRWLRN